MSDMRAGLSQTSGHSLQHFPHSGLPIQHGSGIFVGLDIRLNLLLHFNVDSLTFYDLEEDVVDLSVEYFMLGVEIGVF